MNRYECIKELPLKDVKGSKERYKHGIIGIRRIDIKLMKQIVNLTNAKIIKTFSNEDSVEALDIDCIG